MKEIKLFDYQEDMKSRIEKALCLYRSVMAQMPTGTGKTVLLASVVEAFLREHPDSSVWIVAHRRELVSQIRETIERVFSSKITPSLFTIKEGNFSNHPVPLSKEGSTSIPKPLSPQGTGDVTAPLRRSEPLRSKVGGPSKVSPDCLCGVNRLAANVASIAAFDAVNDGMPVKAVSVQWLAKHYDEIEEEPGMIVIDEAHHALAKTYKEMWERFPKAKFLGLTATPCRLNGKGFTDLFDVLVQSWNIPEFISKGRLATYDFVSIKSDGVTQRLIDSLQKRGADGDYQNKEMDMLLNKQPSIERLYQAFCDFGKDRKGIVYAINISHAKKIAEFYREHGVVAVAIDSKTPSSLRKELIERFKLPSSSFSKTHPSSLTLKGGSTSIPKPLSPQEQGDVTAPPRRSEPLCSKVGGPSKVSPNYLCGVNRLDDRATSDVANDSSLSLPIQVLVNVDIFSEGFDCPDVEFVQLARPTLSLAKYLQMVGRGLRVAKGKKSCVIIDNVGLYRVFGLPSQTWNWNAMFEGRMSKKDVQEAVGMHIANSAAVISEKVAPAKRKVDSEMMMVISHDQLEQTFELQKEDEDIVRKREELLKGKKGKVEFLGKQLVRLTEPNNHIAYIDLTNMNYITWVFSEKKDTSMPRVVNIGGVEFVKYRQCLQTRTKSALTIEYAKGCVQNMGFYSRYLYDASFRMCRILENDRSHYGGHCAVFLHNDPMAYYWLSGELHDGSLVVMSEDHRYYWVEEGKTKVYVGCPKSYEEERKMNERLAEIVKITNLRESKVEQEMDDEKLKSLEPCQIGSKWGLRDRDKRVVVPPIYRTIRMENGYFAFEQLFNHWGVMDSQGKVVILPKYEKVKVTAEGMAILSDVTGNTQTINLR